MLFLLIPIDMIIPLCKHSEWHASVALFLSESESSNKASEYCTICLLFTTKSQLNIKFLAFFLQMCIFCCTFGHLPIGNNSYLAMLERIFQYSLVATFARCSPYYSRLVLFQKMVYTFGNSLPQAQLWTSSYCATKCYFR